MRSTLIMPCCNFGPSRYYYAALPSSSSSSSLPSSSSSSWMIYGWRCKAVTAMATATLITTLSAIARPPWTDSQNHRYHEKDNNKQKYKRYPLLQKHQYNRNSRRPDLFFSKDYDSHKSINTLGFSAFGGKRCVMTTACQGNDSITSISPEKTLLHHENSSESLKHDPSSWFQRNNCRLRNTSADQYFRQHLKIPRPKVMHATLPTEGGGPFGGVDTDPVTNLSRKNNESNIRHGVLVIGDVHGCWDELQLLYEQAIHANHGQLFHYVILVGDLCNKGPDSAKVIRGIRVRHQQEQQQQPSYHPRWYSVRGNHDDGALAAALGDARRRQEKRYQWVTEGEETSEHDNPDNCDIGNDENEMIQDNHADSSSNKRNKAHQITLSDDDVEWLSELPYSITIPGKLLDEPFDTIVVHAGFVPGVPISNQTVETMVTVREVMTIVVHDKDTQQPSNPNHEDRDIISYRFHPRLSNNKHDKEKGKKSKKENKHHRHHHQGNEEMVLDEELVVDDYDEPRPWATVWKGPPRVIFGHDARRGLQQHDWAIGLDTGACYGKQLTGIILPDQKLISVNALKTHNPPGNGPS